MTHPKRLRDWNGLRVRLRGPLRTKGGEVAAHAGALGTIRTSGAKASITVDKCPHCSLSFVCLGLSWDDLPILFEILDPVKP